MFTGRDDVILEVVEIKNVCPFREAAPKPSKRKGAAPRRSYTLSDRGPPSALPPAHVPQLQLEMLCAGAGSALLAIESATRGMALYRMYRDEAYISQMLHFVARFNAEFVLSPTRRWPVGELFGGSTEHAEFLRRTVALAQEAQLMDFVAEPRRPADADARPFLS